jgi:hypothetical protein
MNNPREPVRLRASLYNGLPDDVRSIIVKNAVAVYGSGECRTYAIERRHAERAQALAEYHAGVLGTSPATQGAA